MLGSMETMCYTKVIPKLFLAGVYVQCKNQSQIAVSIKDIV